MALEALPTVRAIDSGRAAPGASRARFLLTTGGQKHVKFLRPDGEGPHALANEYLANRILQLLGVERPGLSLVILPGELKRAAPELREVTSDVGIGLDALPAQDLCGSMIAAMAEKAPDAELLAQCLVLDWIQSNDHWGKNFLGTDHRVLAIDFAGAPAEERWRCQPFDGPERDHGGLRERVQRVDPSIRRSVIEAFDRLDEDTLRNIANEMPGAWASPTERDDIVRKLMARKEAVRARHSGS